MQTRYQLRARKLPEDVKPIAKSTLYDNFIQNNYDIEFTNQDIKYCCVDLKEDIRVGLKQELHEEAIDNNIVKEEANNSEFSQKCIKQQEFVTDEIQCSKCNYYPEIEFSHSCGNDCCEKCGKEFNCRSKFESHLRQHSLIERRQRLFETTTCKICNKVERVSFMKRHLKMHQCRRTCGVCGIVTSSREMRTHIKAHFRFCCDICGHKSQYKENHNRHIKVHEKEKRHPCSECGASFQFLVELARHVTKEHRQIEDGKYECLFCKKIVSAIGHHLRTHQVEIVKCHICNAELKNKSALKEHIRHHKTLSKAGRDRAIVPKNLEKTNVPQNCPCCDKKFASQSHLIRHFKNHLEKPISYSCPHCEMNDFKSQSELINHIINANSSIPGSHDQCPLCFIITPDIENHLTIHQVGRCECEICGKIFANGKQYWKHYNRRHRLKKSQKTTLHILMEKYAVRKLNARKVPCLQCQKSVRISHMKRHMDMFHQTYKCMLCQKVFFDRFSFKLHENTHDRFSQRCPVCTQSFLSHVRLMAHLKMFHKISFSASRSCFRCKLSV